MSIYLTGDRNLIEEFIGGLDVNHFHISGTVNGWRTPDSFPKGMKRSTVISKEVRIAIELSQDREAKRNNLQSLERRLSPSAIILTSSIIVTAAEQSLWVRKISRLIGISAFPTLLSSKLIELAPTIHTDTASLLAAKEFFAQAGKHISVVQDRVGMVMPRILCMIINEAAFALAEQIATPDDIDTAMKLGTNYPLGPAEWGDAIGFNNVEKVLDALYENLHEDRYRTAPLLRQLALGKGWWRT